MKKTLVAIAALAAVGAASAQSSVTLYGRIDASIVSQKTTAGGVTIADPGVQIFSGGHVGNRWGMKGSEDLGGGMKANFQLEQGFNIDDGSASVAANQFNRMAWVGLSGGFGSLNLGRQYDIVDTMYAGYDAMGSSGYTANAALSGAGAVGDTIVRQNNAVMYSTPSMGGFGATVMWAPGENKVPGVNGAGRHMGVMVKYANGPLGVGAGFQSNKAIGGAKATTHSMLGAQYDLGVVRLYGQYDTGRVGAAGAGVNYKDNGYSLGAVVPLGTVRLAGAFAKEDTKNRAGAKMQKTNAFGLLAFYDLSKRTYVYAGARQLRTKVTATGVTTKTSKYGLGLVHDF